MTILRGMTDEMKARGIMRNGEVGLNAVTDDLEVEASMHGPEQGHSGRYRDDITGQVLKDSLVKEARQKELKYFCGKGVWTKKLKNEARAKTGKNAISVRWVDKGDDMNPRYRSRLVARQLKAHNKSRESFFAPTPPLEALRTVLSFAASSIGAWRPCYDPSSNRRMQVSFVDISRAYFNAEIDKDSNTYVQLPEEDEDHDEYCVKLLRHMYGTRAVADGWQEECILASQSRFWASRRGRRHRAYSGTPPGSSSCRSTETTSPRRARRRTSTGSRMASPSTTSALSNLASVPAPTMRRKGCAEPCHPMDRPGPRVRGRSAPGGEANRRVRAHRSQHHGHAGPATQLRRSREGQTSRAEASLGVQRVSSQI